jgi:hypothetical protein
MTGLFKDMLDEAVKVMTGELKPILVRRVRITSWFGTPMTIAGRTHEWRWRCRRCGDVGGDHDYLRALGLGLQHCAEHRRGHPSAYGHSRCQRKRPGWHDFL